MSWDEFKQRIDQVKDLAELNAIEQELFGRKAGAITIAMQGLKDLNEAEKKVEAAKLNKAKQGLLEAIVLKKKTLVAPSSEALNKDGLDLSLDLPETEAGHLHLIPEFIDEMCELFGRMGFEYATGPEMETEDFNFNFLNIPKDHPARDGQDTFWMKDSDKLLRTHTSNVQIHFGKNHKPPFKVIYPGKVFRKDSDATHSPMFHQFEAMMVGKDLSLADMKGVMEVAIREMIGQDVVFRFRPGFFPFVEPGLEVDVHWQGDASDTREGEWLEIVGCGMVHPVVLKNCGIDPDEWQGFAFGFGVERMIMIKHQIPDLRTFYGSDARFLKQF